MSGQYHIVTGIILALAAVGLSPAFQSAADDFAARDWMFADPLSSVLAVMPIVLGAMALFILASSAISIMEASS